MLVLTRKSQDSIRIGDNITVTVLRIKGNTVRIGIEAPDSVRIVRGELPVFNAEESPAGMHSPQVSTDEVGSDDVQEEAHQPLPPTASRLEKYMPQTRKKRDKAPEEGPPPLPFTQDLSTRNTSSTLPPR
ncbi:MAG TPA: carbon storage regulator [Pirellulales bacterium]|jgi:carbon storage regulator CsrA|nr:carbon storage regulator [Pirellulales bacterium]